MFRKKAILFLYSIFISIALLAQSNGNITNAEYSWDSGPSVALVASDGNFNSAVEDIISSASLTNPSGGVHVFSIRVQDEDGNWSPDFKRVINFPIANYTRDLHITQAEYFWDNDPGEGSGTPLIAFDGAFDQALEDAMSASIMPLNGPHILSIRAKDINGNWGPAFRRVVVLEDQTITRDFNITNAEYSWDNGTAIPLIAFDGNFNSAIEDIISSSSLTSPSGGVHVFSIRVQDEDGNWSPDFKRVINFPIANYTRDLHITQAEYFWDNDPGEGSGIPLIAFDGAFDQALEDAMSASIMPLNGPHVLNIRAKDIDGNWGPSFKRVVVFEDQTITRDFNITNAEYSWDNGTAIPLIAFDGNFNSAIEDIISSESLSNPLGGVHVFSIRVQDEDGNWSPDFKRVINFPIANYTRDLYITQAEYFWDNDPGEGNGTPLIAFDGAFDQAFENLTFPTLNLTNGVSVFNIRSRDVNGNWGPIFRRVVSVEAASGCTDTSAFNYNPLALDNDSSCCYISGCMDISACNYDSTACFDDNSCTYDSFSTTYITECDSYSWNGITYSISGEYQFSTLNSVGCDSTATLDLTILNSTTALEMEVNCDSYDWNGQTYTQSGAYTYNTINSMGCDSSITLYLTIFESTTSAQEIVACDNYNWNGQQYTQSGTYIYNTINNKGCDSTVTLNLTILYSSASATDVIACDSYDWNDVTYTESGIYTFTTTNAVGCDSLATLNLTINYSTFSETSIVACDSYYWNGQTYTQSGIYAYHTTNAISCDSTATLNLTINNSSSSTTNITACHQYEWNGTNYYESGTYLHTFTNNVGCDSVASLNLVINTFVLAEYVINDGFCPGESTGYISAIPTFGVQPYSYQWSNGEVNSYITNQAEGEYILTITDSIGCQLTDTISINERTSDLETIVPEICYVTVDDQTGFNKIVVSEVESDQLSGYAIYKEVLTGVYQIITTLDANTTQYVDQTSNPLVNSNRYKVEIIDDCLDTYQSSDYHQTVHLSMNLGLGGSVNLYWGQYEGFEVSSYMVFRGSNVSSMQFIGFVSGNTTSYSDLAPPAGTSLYQVRVVAPICNPIFNPLASVSSTSDTLKSNVVEHEIIEENNDLGANLIINHPTCPSCNDGSIVSIAFGGSAPYTYTWLNGVYTGLNLNLSSGSYTVYISDSEGTLISETVTLSAPSNDVYGCTDSEATNYNSEATIDDGNCEFDGNACDITPTGLFVDNIIDQRVVFNWESPSSAPSYYMIRYRAVGTPSWTVMSAGPQNDVPFEGTSRTRYFMEANTTYQWNIRARDIDQNGTTICQSPWSASHQYTTLPACENMQALTVSTEANWVTFTADAPIGDWGVWQSKGKIREIGTNSFRYINGSNSINVLKGNFKTATDYEWHTKAWCTGNVDSDGNSDPMYHSGWGEFSMFSTEDACDKLPTNLSTGTNNNQNAIVMNWDTPDSGAPDHYFLELTNETTGQLFQWNNIAGNSNSKTKFGQTTGNDYSWKIRGACGANGTSWATSFTSPAYYTLGAQRINGNTISSLEVFPNPSKGLFSISFESKESQNIEISITNYLGEKVFNQEVSNLINTYNKTIDLSNKSNGIYLLSIKTNNKIFNKKIVIQ